MLCADIASPQAQPCSRLGRFPRVGHLGATWEVCIIKLEEGALKSEPTYQDTLHRGRLGPAEP